MSSNNRKIDALAHLREGNTNVRSSFDHIKIEPSGCMASACYPWMCFYGVQSTVSNLTQGAFQRLQKSIRSKLSFMFVHSSSSRMISKSGHSSQANTTSNAVINHCRICMQWIKGHLSQVHELPLDFTGHWPWIFFLTSRKDYCAVCDCPQIVF